tara:strand:+ start:1666 stop:3162 length:1497 start_codon:yes stop_codon:yes gene_type:complete
MIFYKNDFIVIVFGLLVHLLLSLTINLSPDEAHYALYSFHLDWSYFDHPPMVGWIQKPFLYLGGTDLLMRIVPMFSWLLTIFFLSKLSYLISEKTYRFFGIRAELLIFFLSPLFHLLGIALVPDSLLIPLTLLTVLITWELCKEKNQRKIYLWFYLGISLGLSGLTKYTAFLSFIGVVLSLIYSFGWRILIFKGFWFSVAVGLVIISPVIYWNFLNDWISFKYQIYNASGGSEWKVFFLLRFLIVIWIAYGILIPICLFYLKKFSNNNVDFLEKIKFQKILLFFSIPGIFLWILLSIKGSTLPHWASPSIITIVPLCVLGLNFLNNKYKIFFSILISTQGIILFFTFFLLFSGGIVSNQNNLEIMSPGKKNNKQIINPIADLYGWKIAAEKAKDIASERKIDSLAVHNWTLASRIAWYARPFPVKVVNSNLNQFDLWFGTIEKNERILLIDWSNMTRIPPVGKNKFKNCEKITHQETIHFSRKLSYFQFLVCEGWQSN